MSKILWVSVACFTAIVSLGSFFFALPSERLVGADRPVVVKRDQAKLAGVSAVDVSKTDSTSPSGAAVVPERPTKIEHSKVALANNFVRSRSAGRALARHRQKTGTREHILQQLASLSDAEIEEQPLLRDALIDLRRRGLDPKIEYRKALKQPQLPTRRQSTEEAQSDIFLRLQNTIQVNKATAQTTFSLGLNRFPGPDNLAIVLQYDPSISVAKLEPNSVVQATGKEISFKNQGPGRSLILIKGSATPLSPGSLCQVVFRLGSKAPLTSQIAMTNVVVVGQSSSNISAQGATLKLRERS